MPPAAIVTFAGPPSGVLNTLAVGEATMLAVAGAWLSACPLSARTPSPVTTINGR